VTDDRPTDRPYYKEMCGSKRNHLHMIPFNNYQTMKTFNVVDQLLKVQLTVYNLAVSQLSKKTLAQLLQV